MALKFSIPGQVLCNAEECTNGIPATLLVFVDRPLTPSALLGFQEYGGIAMHRVVSVGPELPPGWTVVKPPHPEHQVPWFFCPEHEPEAEELAGGLNLDAAEEQLARAEALALRFRGKP